MRSQNGWLARKDAPTGQIPWVTGRVMAGDVAEVLNYLGRRFNDEVEHIRRDWSWGWNYRPIRGARTTSNHASGTAVDFNAPAHLLGKRGTFSKLQVERIHKILRDLDGVVRWGGDYSGRADEMHFEINRGVGAVHDVAGKIRAGTLTARAWRWNPDVVSDLAIIQRQFQIAAGVREGKIQRYHGIAAIQNALNVKFLPHDRRLAVDGYCGKRTVQAWWEYETSHTGTGRASTPDPVSLRSLEINYRFKGPETK